MNLELISTSKNFQPTLHGWQLLTGEIPLYSIGICSAGRKPKTDGAIEWRVGPSLVGNGSTHLEATSSWGWIGVSVDSEKYVLEGKLASPPKIQEWGKVANLRKSDNVGVRLLIRQSKAFTDLRAARVVNHEA